MPTLQNARSDARDLRRRSLNELANQGGGSTVFRDASGVTNIVVEGTGEGLPTFNPALLDRINRRKQERDSQQSSVAANPEVTNDNAEQPAERLGNPAPNKYALLDSVFGRRQGRGYPEDMTGQQALLEAISTYIPQAANPPQESNALIRGILSRPSTERMP